MNLDQSVLESLDAETPALLEFLPYILQDVDELGTDATKVCELLGSHLESPSDKNVLDLACGKGEVSLRLAAELGCHCVGVDGLEAFILEARSRANTMDLEDQCQFVFGDFRQLIDQFKRQHVVILGGCGPVFGDYDKTFSQLVRCLSHGGYLLLDEAYVKSVEASVEASIEASIEISDNDADLLSKSAIVSAAMNAGLTLIDERVYSAEQLRRQNSFLLECITFRCEELARQYPQQKSIFMDYVLDQQEQNDCLQSRMRSALILFKYTQAARCPGDGIT